MNGTRLGHKAGDEGDIAGEPVELGDDHRALCRPGLSECRGQLGPTIQGVCAPPGLHLDELREDRGPLPFTKAGYRGALRLNAEP